MAQLNVNTDAVVSLTNKLEKLSRSAFPVAVRSTLNSAAFDVKGKSMPLSAKRFTQRQPNFFKANSKVFKAQGFDLRTMEAKTGFIDTKLKGSSNFAVKDLEQQEEGGKIKGKSFIPMEEARKGSNATPVRPVNRLNKINRVVKQRRFSGNKKQQLIKAVHAAKRGGHVLGGTGSKETLFKVRSLTKKGRFRIEPLYSYEKARSVKVKATGFMTKAAMASSRKIDRFYKQNAQRQFDKVLK